MRSITLPKPNLKLSMPRKGGRSVVGLDIEPGAIHVAEAVAGPDGPVVRRAVSRPLDPGIVRDGEIVEPDALADALRSLFEEHGFDKHVRVGLANQRIVVRTMDLPPIRDAKELAAAVNFQAPSEVPMPLDQAVVDHVSLGIVDTEEGPRARVVLVAARRELVERVLGAVRQAGLKPEGVDLSAFALVRSLTDGADESVAYLAVGGAVNLVVAHAGICHFTRVVAGGLESMAGELAERTESSVETAREEIFRDGIPADRDDRSVVADGVRRIAADVRASLDFHGAEVNRVVLTGPGLGVPGLAEALAEHLRLDVVPGIMPVPDDPTSGRFAVAAGLAIEERAA